MNPLRMTGNSKTSDEILALLADPNCAGEAWHALFRELAAPVGEWRAESMVTKASREREAEADKEREAARLAMHIVKARAGANASPRENTLLADIKKAYAKLWPVGAVAPENPKIRNAALATELAAMGRPSPVDERETTNRAQAIRDALKKR
jgi:hypothetical protein